MSYYYSRHDDLKINRLPSGLFFRVDQAEQLIQPPLTQSRDIGQSRIAHREVNYNDFVIPEYRSTKDDKELYLPLLEVSVEVEAVATIAWTRLTQTFTNQATHSINEAIYCFPLYDKSTVTAFTCTIGSDKVLKGVVKPKPQAKAEFKEAVARQRVAALLEEHTPEVFETSVGNIPAQTTVKIDVCYITELKADLSGDGILITIPTSVAPRYGAPPSSISSLSSPKSLAVPPENGLQIQIQVSSPVTISKIESRTHPVSVEMGSHGHTTTRNIRDLSKRQTSPSFDPKKAKATLSDRSACLGKDFVLLIQARDGELLASRALIESHPKTPNHSALMVSINLRDLYTPNVVAPKETSEIIFLADRSGSMQGKMETLKTAMRFFLKSLPNNCTFNICSFGNSHTLMWPESRPYNQENVDAASSYIMIHFAADMGGTELLCGLRHVVQESKSSVNTEIIILTDGEVWDSDSTFQFIRKTRSSGPKEKFRFFCLGIGEAVSHHLVTGIGRHGGGLSEVVPTDPAGDWMRKVIGMLRATLTPSSWKVEIIIDDLSISGRKGEGRVCVQAPHHIPEFHAFSRSSVYFLFRQELGAKVVKIKATAVSSGESVTAELAIERLETRRTCMHLLASKALLGDLERGQSWLHDKSSNDNNTGTMAGVDDLARTEGEKIGAEWSLSSKWTSFIVVDDNNSLEKPSRWYRAEKSDLAELTRPRLDAWNYPISMNGIDATSSFTPSWTDNSLHTMDYPAGGDYLVGPSMAAITGDFGSSAISSERGASNPPPRRRATSPDSLRRHKRLKLSRNISESARSIITRGKKESRPTIRDTTEPPLDPNISNNGTPYPPLSSWRTKSRDVELGDRFKLRSTCLYEPEDAFEHSGNGGTSDHNVLDFQYSSLPIQGPNLEALLDSQIATGAFKLSPQLRTALRAKFKPGVVMREVVKFTNVDEVLDTAMPVVYIEEVFADNKSLWNLVVQKARVWLEGLISEERHRDWLFRVLRRRLRGVSEDMEAEGDEEKVENFSMSEEEARKLLCPDRVPKQESTDSQARELVVGQNDGDFVENI